MKDLTKGKPSRLILAFAIPIFMANILQLTYSIVDTRIVGSYLGENSLAAVGATTTLSNLMIGFLMGLANGFAIITAQKFGARDYAGVKKSFALSIKMGCIIALTITVLCLLFLRQILGFLNVSNDLMGMAVSYIFIIIAGLVATFLYDACAAALRALGDTVTPLVILAVSVCLNMAGDIFFVVVLKAGVAGAAIATVLAQVIAFIVCYVYMVKRYELLRLSRSDLFDSHLLRRHLKSSDENCDTEGAECKDSENNMTPEVIAVMKMTMLKAGLSMAFMSSLVNIGSLTLQTAINRLGQDIIVAHTAARKISEIFMVMFTVFGQTLAIFYTCIWCTMAIIASYTIGPWLVKLVTGTNNPIVIKNATNYLKFDTLFYYVTAVICIVRNAMQGLGEQITPLVSSSLEMVGKIVIAFTLVPLLGYTGVIVAEPIVWFIMVIPLLVKIYNMPVLRKRGHGI